jgi:hypothetical protein
MLEDSHLHVSRRNPKSNLVCSEDRLLHHTMYCLRLPNYELKVAMLATSAQNLYLPSPIQFHLLLHIATSKLRRSMAARPEALAFSARTLDREFESRMGHVCPWSLHIVLLCVGTAHATGLSLAQAVLPYVVQLTRKPEIEARGHTGCRVTDNNKQ